MIEQSETAIKPSAEKGASKSSKLSIVIINYNTRDCLHNCLASIIESAGSQSSDSLSAGAGASPSKISEIIVVDNASSDGSVEMVRTHFPQVTLHARQTNNGYGAAANAAIAESDADYILLLNSDTLLQAGVVAGLRRYLDQHPRVAVVGPRLHNLDGTLQASCYPAPTPFNLFLEESLLGRLAAYLPGVRQRYLRTWAHDSAKAVPWVLGAALAIRREAFLAVGGFDPAFRLYFEETDLCHRLWAAGWAVHFAPVGTIVHLGGASTSQHYARTQHQLFDSAQLFYARHYSRGHAVRLRLVMIPALLGQLAHDVVRYVRAWHTPGRERSSEILHVRYRLLCRHLFPSTRRV